MEAGGYQQLESAIGLQRFPYWEYVREMKLVSKQAMLR